jgi:16S rRNA C967 or C1407 C5-methylase (RsmB/RsmF family)
MAQGLRPLKAKEAVGGRLAINPPLSFRVRGAVDESLLASIACGKPKLPDWASRFDFRECSEPEALFKTGLFERGIVYAQDPATAYAVSLAADAGRVKGRILDLCAAPGGKTLMHSGSAGDAPVIIAADRSPRPCLGLRELQAPGRRIELAWRRHRPPFPKESFDLVFADVLSNPEWPEASRRPLGFTSSPRKLEEAPACIQSLRPIT